MKSFFKVSIIICITAFTVLLLISCKKEQTITFYCDPLLYTRDVEKKIEIFEKKNIGIKVVTLPADYNTLLEELDNSKNLHIVRYSSDVLSDSRIREYLVSPTALFDRSFLFSFHEKALSTVTNNSILYGIPEMFIDSVVLYYNGSFLTEEESSQITLRSLPWFLKKKKDVPYGLVYNHYDPYLFYALLSASGLKMSSSKDFNNFYSKETIRLFDLLSKMTTNNTVPFPADVNEARALFNGQKSLLYLSYYKEFAKLKAQNTNVRILDGTGFIKKQTSPGSWIRSYAYGIAGKMDSSQKETARKFIRHMLTPESPAYYETFNAFPAQKSLITEEIELILKNTHTKPAPSEYALYYKSLYEIQHKFYNGQLSLEEAVLRIHNGITTADQ